MHFARKEGYDPHTTCMTDHRTSGMALQHAFVRFQPSAKSASLTCSGTAPRLHGAFGASLLLSMMRPDVKIKSEHANVCI